MRQRRSQETSQGGKNLIGAFLFLASESVVANFLSESNLEIKFEESQNFPLALSSRKYSAMLRFFPIAEARPSIPFLPKIFIKRGTTLS